MSEIVSSPLIFSQQEVKDRFLLHQFIHRLFEPCKAHKGDLIGLPADELFNIFKIQYPMNILNAAIVSNMLLTGGFIDEENPEISVLYARLDSSTFLSLKKEAQICLLRFIKPPMDIKYRQIVLGIVVVNDTTGQLTPRVEHTISTFIQMFTLNRNNASNYMASFTPQYRCSVLELYSYYATIARLYKWPVADKYIFLSQLESLGFKSTKGRVHAKAGIRYFTGLYIPNSIEDKVLTVELNMCCIFNGNTHWSREGILENMIEAQREDLCDRNLERIGIVDEQKRKTFEEEKAKVDIRRAFEEGEIPLGQRTQTIQAEDDMGYYGGSEPVTEETETEALQIESEDSISRTSGFNGTEDRNTADEYQVRNTVDLSEPLDIGESYRDRYAQFCEALGSTNEDPVGPESIDEEVGGDVVDRDGPSFEEIASALVVPYTMSVATGFTKDVMLSWLQKMSIPEPEIVLEHYDEIMEILVNS